MKININKKIAIIIAIAAIFVVGLGIGIVTLSLKDKIALKIPPIEKYKQAQAEKKAQEIGPLINLTEIIVNLYGGGILKTEITIEATNSKSAESLKIKEVFLRDRTISVLAAKQISDVKSTQGHDMIKEELIKELNKISPNDVKDVLFRNFVYSY